jgi:hypothetical protein
LTAGGDLDQTLVDDIDEGHRDISVVARTVTPITIANFAVTVIAVVEPLLELAEVHLLSVLGMDWSFLTAKDICKSEQPVPCLPPLPQGLNVIVRCEDSKFPNMSHAIFELQDCLPGGQLAQI